jgi:hypothetical protein
VTSSFDNTVTKLRASDGANLGTFNLGGASYGVAFDGTNLWFTNGLTDTVTELRPSDGAILGNFPVGQNPYDCIFDGTSIWCEQFSRWHTHQASAERRH